MSSRIDAYLEAHTSLPSDLLQRLYRETHLKVLHPRMLSGPVQGQLLQLLSKIIRPRFVLEVGTFTGYSALCLAAGLQPGGKLYTIDKNDELAPLSTRYFKEAGWEDRIELLTGDALEIIPTLQVQFDLVFLDGNKKEYLEYYHRVLDKMPSGAVLLADNVLWDGKVVQEVDPNDQDTLSIMEFNRFVQQDIRVENVMLPLRDGLSLIRKL